MTLLLLMVPADDGPISVYVDIVFTLLDSPSISISTVGVLLGKGTSE